MGTPPAPASRQPSASRQPPSGRVFAIQVVEEEPAANDVVAGIISINSIQCKALFDTSASHSFISRSFAMTHGLKVLKSMGITAVQVQEHSFMVRV